MFLKETYDLSFYTSLLQRSAIFTAFLFGGL